MRSRWLRAASAGRQCAPAALDQALVRDVYFAAVGGESFSQSWFLRYTMLHTRTILVPVALAVGLTSCVVAVAPVPGSEKVRLTRNASEVSTCSAVGNIRVNAGGSSAPKEFRNMVVGFGGNTGLVTSGPTWTPVEGIAYRCP